MTFHLLGALALLATPGNPAPGGCASGSSASGIQAPGIQACRADTGAETALTERPRVIVRPAVPGLTFDAALFFDHLVARYRGLEQYRDETSVIQTTRPLGEERSHRVETRIRCEVNEGRLNVLTPASQVGGGVLHGLGLALSLLPPPGGEAAGADEGRDAAGKQSGYDLWLAPHLALKFAENPLGELRAGVPEGFTATEAAPVTIDDKPMVHIELKSGDGLSGDYTAKFDLYVDPDSMLIERIDGQQRLPDGADFQTTMDIRPMQAEGAAYVRPGPDGFTEPVPRPCGIDADAPVEEEADGAAPEPEPEPVAPPQTAPGMPVG